jgi:HEAT repeat protein
MDEAWQELSELLDQQSPRILSAAYGQLLYQDAPLQGTPNASRHLAMELERRSIRSLAFIDGMDRDELQTLLFALQLRPERLQEMGGTASFLPEDACIRIIGVEETLPSSFASPTPSSRYPQQIAQRPNPPNGAELAENFRHVFRNALRTTRTPAIEIQGINWSNAEKDALRQTGLMVPDFSPFAGMEQTLSLSSLDPITIREAMGQSLAGLSAQDLGAILLGLLGFPQEEQGTYRALEHLAPEILAQAIWDVEQRTNPGPQSVAALGAALVRSLKDRELAMDILRERLLSGGWNADSVETLHNAILWHLQVGDGKTEMDTSDFFDLPPYQATAIIRHLLREKRWAELGPFLDLFRDALLDEHESRRSQAASILAALVTQVEKQILPEDLEQRLWTLIRCHLDTEDDETTCLWTCHALESVFSHWIQVERFEDAYREMAALQRIASTLASTAPWKAQAIHDALARVASLPNLTMLEQMLHYFKHQASAIAQIHALLGILGRQAAAYLVVRLELEDDRSHRVHLLAALRSIGRPATQALRNALGSPLWYLVRNAALLLGEIGDDSAVRDLVLTLEHRDLRVRKAAEKALSRLQRT